MTKKVRIKVPCTASFVGGGRTFGRRMHVGEEFESLPGNPHCFFGSVWLLFKAPSDKCGFHVYMIRAEHGEEFTPDNEKKDENEE